MNYRGPAWQKKHKKGLEMLVDAASEIARVAYCAGWKKGAKVTENQMKADAKEKKKRNKQ